MFSASAARRAVAVALAVSLVLVAPAHVAVGGLSGTVGEEASPLQTADPTPTNNTTLHENPEGLRGDGNLRAVQRWLSGRMGQVLVDCSAGLRIGAFAPCDRLDGEYPDWLSKYVDVADETESEDDDEAAEAFDAAREDQQQLRNQTAQFREHYAAYQDAVEAGEFDEARRHARQLIRVADRANRTGRSLVNHYRVITRESQANVSEGRTEVLTLLGNFTRIAERVEAEQFINTTLTARTRSEEISFRRPLVVSGRLRAANGTPLANRTIRVHAGDTTLRTRTNASGGFTLTHRPTSMAADTDAIEVRFVPAETSPFAADRVSLPITVEAVEAAMNVTIRPARAGYADRVAITGRVVVQGVPVSDVPIRVSIGDDLGFESRTDATGRYAVAFSVPKTLPVGERTAVAVLPFEGRAIERATASGTVRIESTPTALDLTVNETGAREISVEGRLATAGGIGVGAEPVLILFNGSGGERRVHVVRTGADGGFSSAVQIPTELLPEDGNTSVRVLAVYQAAGTNLERSRAIDTLLLTAPPETPREPPGGLVGVLTDPAEAIDALVSVISTAVSNPAQLIESLVASLFDAASNPFETVRALLVRLLLLAVIGLAVVLWRFRALRTQVPRPDLDRVSVPISAWLGRVRNGIVGLAGRPFDWWAAWTRGSGESVPTPDEGDVHAEPIPTAGAAASEGSERGGPLELARRHLLADDTDRAVVVAYQAVRDRVGGGDGYAHGAATHREFLSTLKQDGVDEETVAELTEMTEAYERAAYSRVTTSAEVAAAVLESAQRLVEGATASDAD